MKTPCKTGEVWEFSLGPFSYVPKKNVPILMGVSLSQSRPWFDRIGLKPRQKRTRNFDESEGKREDTEKSSQVKEE